MRESVDIEFKELDSRTGGLPGSISKDIVAFANTEGGELYIGIRDDGTVAGVEDTDDVMTRLSNVAHDTIRPDIMPFLQIRTVEMEGKQVIRADISVGTQRPYYLAKEGLKPKGVYIRVGTACIPVGESGIREMIMDTSGKSFEESRSLNQELTFSSLEEEMREHGLALGQAQMRSLKLLGSDDLYTNLALLLSDQCEHTIKTAIFQGGKSGVFRERKEFSGSLLKQLKEAYQLLDFYNRTEASFVGLRRQDQRDYPQDALREALLNSIIHRDYAFSGSTIINIYEDRIEFISLGGLVRGLSMEAVFMGISQSRNPNLAAVFYRLGFVESYGTGIRKINSLYDGFGRTQVFKTAEGAFVVELANRNYRRTDTTSVQAGNISNSVLRDAAGSESLYGYQVSLIDEDRERVISLAKEKKVITRKEAEDAIGCGTTKAYKILKQLCDEGFLTQQKRGKLTVYAIYGVR